MQVQALNGVVAANGPPTLATHGVPLWRDSRAQQFVNPQLDGFFDNVDKLHILIRAAGSTVASLAFARLWGYFRVSKGAAGANAPQGTDASFWAPMGTGTGANKGKLNAGAAIDETSAGVIVHDEERSGFREPDRVYIELGVFTNVTTVDAWLVSRGQVNS